MLPKILVIFFATISGINSQQSYFSLPSRLRFTRGEFPVPLFYQASSPPTSAPTSRTDLQQQFTDIFNWSKDLVNDSRFKGCPVPNISDISNSSPKSSLFFGLNPQHRMAAMRLRSILNDEKNLEKKICLAGALRDLPGINPNAWIRGVFGAYFSTSELFSFNAPPLVEVMPNIFLSREALQTAREQGNNPDQSARGCTVVDGRVGSDNGIENVLWYFREDLQVNSFHLNWHLIYPINGPTKADRQGELFYFSHHSHLARYHAERLSLGLSQIAPLFIDHNTVIGEQYNSHLDDTNSGQTWTPRRANILVQDTLFENMVGAPPFITVANQSELIARVVDSIRRGELLLPNRQGAVLLDSRTGVDLLGDLIEATTYTINGDYYGSFGFHNEGHVLLGFIEDPQNVTGLPPGVMAEVATAMRDPIFYRYHTAVDQVFDVYKELLVPYQREGGELPLRWEGIDITQFHVTQDDATLPANRLTTFFTQNTFELSRGLDFQGSGVQGNVGACVTQLNHNMFTYTIDLNRAPTLGSGMGTVRIFMAPRFNERGERYSILDQRKLFFMMDLFRVELQPGLNRITRRSTESSLTITPPSDTSSETRYCGCGWPNHMLVPRGTEAGMAFDLFVMLTNGNEDTVRSTSSAGQAPQAGQCAPAPIYCGRMNDTYPDARPMGYPFDRLPYAVASADAYGLSDVPRYVATLEEYVAGIGNIAIAEVTITHVGSTAAVLQSQNILSTNLNPSQADGITGQDNSIRRRRARKRARVGSSLPRPQGNSETSSSFAYYFRSR